MISGGNDYFYYEIGGARALPPPPTPIVNSVTLGGSASMGVSFACGKFDPVAGIAGALNNIANGVDNMVNQMVNAATSAIANLPSLLLQRANPGLYDLFQNGLLKAEQTVTLATKSCEQMQAEIAKGKNPFDQWVTLSMGNDWRVQMGTGGLASSTDVVSARDAVEEDSGDNGIPWPNAGGQAGGVGQPPIKIVEDTTKAGWTSMHGLSPAAGASAIAAAAAAGGGSHLASVWPTPTAAATWAKEVLGEVAIRTCDGCERASTSPGVGLLNDQDAGATQVATDLTKLVDGTLSITASNLEKVEAPGIGISTSVIEAIRDLPGSDRSLVIGKLAGEIATARTLDKALLLRRLLISGSQTPEIKASPAPGELREKLDRLNDDIDNLLFETRARREIVSRTTTTLLRLKQARDAGAIGHPSPVRPRNPHPMDDFGAVR